MPPEDVGDHMVKGSQEYIVDERGRKRAVVLPMQRYNGLQEDLHDLTVIAERRDEELVSLSELRRRLVADGVLQD